MLYQRNHYGGLQFMIQRLTSLKSIMAVAVMLFLFSCTNDPEEVKSIVVPEDLPMEETEDLDLSYSDSGYVRLNLKAPRAEYYPNLEEPERRFPNGIDVKFFDSFGKEESRLQADYAVQFMKKGLWQATGNVVVVNRKGEQLNTEELFWNEKTEEIYSDVFVRLSTGQEVIMGEGFKADQTFDNYEINKVTGTIEIEDEENVEDR
jgi:LPS export ABC transporter protein LptC